MLFHIALRVKRLGSLEASRPQIPDAVGYFYSGEVSYDPAEFEKQFGKEFVRENFPELVEPLKAMSACYVIIYLGESVPVLGAGYGADRIGLFPAVAAFAAAIGGLGLLAAVLAMVWGKEKTRAPEW